MNTLHKFERREQRPIKEFAPRDRSVALSAGGLIVRANDGSSLAQFDEMFAVMAADGLTFEPPLQLDRGDVEVVRYGGERYAKTFGLEVTIPEGYAIPADYVRIDQVELTG